MKVLVTGERGYLGCVLTRMLEQEGIEWTGWDTDFYHGCDFGRGLEPGAGPGPDIRSAGAVDLRGFDAVCHLAALSNDPLGELNPELAHEINHLATVRIAKAARRAGVKRFVFSSSCSNYGAAGADFVDEQAPLKPLTAYGRSKVAAERDLLALADDAFSPVILRNATAYGVSSRLRCDVVLNNLVAWAWATGDVLIKSDGSPWRPIVHVEDICQAFLRALQAPRDRIHAEVYNVGRTDENFQVREIADIVAETVPDCRIRYSGDAGPDTRSYRVNCEKIAGRLGFEPRWTARQGARELYDAFRSEELTLEQFEGPSYQRIARIRQLLKTGRLDADLYWA